MSIDQSYRLNREDCQLAAALEGESDPKPSGKTLLYSCPQTRIRRERARDADNTIILSPASGVVQKNICLAISLGTSTTTTGDMDSWVPLLTIDRMILFYSRFRSGVKPVNVSKNSIIDEVRCKRVLNLHNRD